MAVSPTVLNHTFSAQWGTRIAAGILTAIALSFTTGCSGTSPDAAGPPTTPSSPAASPPSASTDPQQALKDRFPDLMHSLNFFPGTPDSAVDADADAVCGQLATQSKSAVIAYEESVDKGTDTGMTSNDDIQRFVNAAITAFCPQYAGR